MKTQLSIDTSKTREISVTLIYKDRKYQKKLPSTIARAQTALPMIEQLLKRAKLSLIDIEEIHVAQGNESLTGTRVGFAIANALATLLQIPVNGKIGLAFPQYSDVKYGQ